MSKPPLAGLHDEVDRLRSLRQALARRLFEAAEQLDCPGLPPAASLIDDLLAYRRNIQSMAAALGAESGDDALSLNDLERLIESRELRRSAAAVLETLTGLTHVDDPDFAPLVLCQREASRLCELAAESSGGETNPELELLSQRRHPLNSLIRLCDERDRLSDADWTDCHDNVAATYGRQLATALTRGRIQRRGRGAETRSEAGDQMASSTQRLATAAEMIFEPANETIFEAAQPGPSAAARLRLAAFPLEVPEPPPALMKPSSTVASPGVKPSFIVASPGVSPTSPVTSAGAPAVQFPTGETNAAGPKTPDPKTPDHYAPGKEDRSLSAPNDRAGVRGETAPELVVRLVAEDRLPLAMQLARCLELKPELQRALPPSWILRALILGRHLSYSKGEIARQLEDELREFRPEMLAEGSEDRQRAMAFLLRAAALPAVLLAGSATATGILRGFKIAPGDSQLYNYCSRIALYGDRLAGNLVEMFRPAGTITGASELHEISRSSREWLQQAARNTVVYGRSSPLFLHAHWTLTSGTAVRHADETFVWCKWQETLSLCHRLLKPVFEGATGERNWVRQEIARLTSQIRVEPLDAPGHGGTQTPAGRPIVLPKEEMHATILEAVAVANRWLRLCHQTVSPGGSPIPVEALELRDEILKRSEGVLAELTQHRNQTSSPLVKASIACCQAAVRHIQALFESRISLPLVEPDPRHVLNAELLRVPGIELDDQWLPVTEPAVVERELVAVALSSGLSWRQSYNHHAASGNLEATGRLLELDVWSGPGERESLAALRQSQMDESRTTLEFELEELAGDIATLAETGAWNDVDTAAFYKRLEHLRYQLPRELNFGSFRRQVGQLQSTVLRQRAGTGRSSTGFVAGLPASLNADSQRGPLSASDSPFEPVTQSCDIFSEE
jgi:hypothetical protein